MKTRLKTLCRQPGSPSLRLTGPTGFAGARICSTEAKLTPMSN
jgi:hypothetical protein